MSDPRADDNRPVHFVGIAGAGMSALAELFVRRGYRVTGCDANLTSADDLRRLNVDLFTGHDPAHVAGVSEVIVTSAVRKDHPELVRARELGIPVTRRAEAGGSHRAFVVEADEYDRSFLALTPTIAVVTNVEEDHLDIYPGGLVEIRDAFAEFVRPARVIVLCADDAGSSTLPVPNTAEVIRYGIDSDDARLRAADIEPANRGSVFGVEYDGEELGRLSLRVPGIHNVKNALAAVASGIALGLELDAMRAGLESFGGVERRFELVGEMNGVTIIDDYAHHPTEIRATLEAARAAYPKKRIIAAFQPHLYSRTRDFYHEFAAVLSTADVVYLCDLYPAREQPVPGVSSALIATAMREKGCAPKWEGPRSALAAVLARDVRENDLVVTMGAGDITKTGPELIRLLEEEH